MATTPLVLISNRHLSEVYLQAGVSGVALDATVTENFTLPAGFGSLMGKVFNIAIGSLSGAYVAPAPAFDGMELSVISADASTRVDVVGSGRFVNYSTSSARPNLVVSWDLQNYVLCRLGERFLVQLPVIAGAGVTGSVQFGVRGLRFQTA